MEKSVIAYIPGGVLVPILAFLATVYYYLKKWRQKTEEATVRMPRGVSRNRQAIGMKPTCFFYCQTGTQSTGRVNVITFTM